MSWNSKVVWSEGMLLQPQHLQQHDRYLQTQLEARVGALRPYAWGVSRLEIDQQQLALGKLALLSFSAVLPDGTPVGSPAEEEMPPPLEIPADVRDVTVVLALPTRRHGVAEVDDRPGHDNFARHRSAEHEAWDSNGLDNSALMTIGKLRLRLALESDVADACITLGVARVVERRPDNRVVLDPGYCPPVLEVRAAPALGALSTSCWACYVSAARRWPPAWHSQAAAAPQKSRISCCCSCSTAASRWSPIWPA